MEDTALEFLRFIFINKMDSNIVIRYSFVKGSEIYTIKVIACI